MQNDYLPLSLVMIVRDSEETLRACLDSIHEQVDEIVIVDTGSKDATIEVASSYGAQIHHFNWIDDFSAARNFSFSKATHPHILWLDDDDVVMNAKDLCFMARAAFSLGFTECWVDYDYHHDRFGNCRRRQQRERFLHRDIYEWRERVHETPCAKYLAEQQTIPREQGWVKHTSYMEDLLDQNRRAMRNLAILQDMDKKRQMNHRMAFLYANTLKSVGKTEDALLWYRRYTKECDRSAHHYAALVEGAQCLMAMQRLQEARLMLAEAIIMYPYFASAYVRMAQIHALLGEYDRAEEWANEVEHHEKSSATELMRDPTDILVVPHTIRANACLERGELEKASEEIKISLKYYPDNEGVLHVNQKIQDRLARAMTSKAYMLLNDAIGADEKPEVVTRKREALAASAPHLIRFLPQVLQHRSRPARGDKMSIGLFCPANYEIWGPDSLETGIGGSETAVIQMSRELVKLDWDVTVYAHTDQIGTFDGVHWTHYQGFNDEKDHHDVMVTWRHPESPIRVGQNCKVSVFWAHDILQENRWYHDPTLFYDKVFVLSDYHKELYLKRIPEDLLYVTANGTDPALWVAPQNEPGRLIYSSCPSRGLMFLLREWSYILDEYPDAKLDIYYGWNQAFQLQAKSSPIHKLLYLEVERLKKQPGITWHGRVSKQELHEAQARAQIWAYPCIFPEISCITGMEVQIHGATPVCTDFAALNETVQFGLKGHYNFDERKDQVRYATTVIDELKNPSFKDKEKMVSWARERFRWETIALQWDQLLRPLVERSGSEVRRIKPGQLPKRPSLLTA